MRRCRPRGRRHPAERLATASPRCRRPCGRRHAAAPPLRRHRAPRSGHRRRRAPSLKPSALSPTKPRCASSHPQVTILAGRHSQATGAVRQGRDPQASVLPAPHNDARRHTCFGRGVVRRRLQALPNRSQRHDDALPGLRRGAVRFRILLFHTVIHVGLRVPRLQHFLQVGALVADQTGDLVQ